MDSVSPSNTVNTQRRVPTPAKLGLVACTALVIGNVIGSGIYLLPASLAPFGGLALVGWGVSAAGAIFVALVFASLARMVPSAGGPYAYSRKAFGDFAGFLIAWGYWIGVWASVGAVAVAMVSYLGGLVPSLNSSPILAGAVAIGTVWLLTFVNLRGVALAGQLQTITVIIKLIPLVAVGTIGLFWANWANFAPTVPPQYPGPMSAIVAAASLTLFAFLGIESATVPADDVGSPQRTIPRATVLGTVIAAAVYLLSTIGVMGAVPPEQLATSPAPVADAAAAMWGSWAYPLVIFGAVISCFGAINGFILLQGQVPMAAARDRLFPGPFARLSDKGVPAFGCIVSSVLITILLGFNYLGQQSGGSGATAVYESILLLATFVTLVPYAFCAMAEIMLFVRDPEEYKAEKSTAAIIIASIAFLFSLLLIVGGGAVTALLGFLMLLLGLPVYVWMHKPGTLHSDDSLEI